MFEIYDGRSQFYQWDLDRKIIVKDNTINQVHFCNRTDECSLICEVYDLDGLRVADVPNILLQDNWRINIYGYDHNYTKHSDVFDVVKRSKPADYVYTETETLNYNTLLERMDEIDANIANTVDEYLKENPVEVDLTGYYTKNEVDAAIETIELTPGPAGPQGEPGPAGKDGYTPIKGVDYFDGEPGKDGQDGAIGPQGPAGATGPQGPEGPQGPQGEQGPEGPAGKDGAPGADYVLTDEDKQEIAAMVDVSGGGSGEGGVAEAYYFEGYNKNYLTANDKAKLDEIHTYYLENKKLPYDVWVPSSTSRSSYRQISRVEANEGRLTLTAYEKLNRYEFVRMKNASTGAITYNVYSYLENASDWHWYETGSVSGISSYAHLRIVGYWNNDSSSISTFSVSTSNGNVFGNESYSYYFCAASAPSTGYVGVEFFNSDGDSLNVYLHDANGNNSSASLTILGFYYWGT